MKRDRVALAAELSALRATDFDEGDPAANGMERLYELCDELSATCSAKEAAEMLLPFVECLDGVCLGSPGPVVHTLEKMRGYEPYLRESLLRKPTPLTVWMANRVANAHRSDREEWVRLIEAVARNPDVPREVREEARAFAEHQRAA